MAPESQGRRCVIGDAETALHQIIHLAETRGADAARAEFEQWWRRHRADRETLVGASQVSRWETLIVAMLAEVEQGVLGAG